MLILMDGTQDSEKLLDLSVRLFDNRDSSINATFVNGLRNKNLDNLFELPGSVLNSYYSYAEILDKILHTESDNSNEFIKRFVNKCEELNIKTRIYLNEDSFEKGFIKDSLYSDLLVIGKNILLRNANDQSCCDLLEAMLHTAKCPILITPNESLAFKNIVLLFDGSEKSFEAIKLFVYLISDQLKTNRVTLFTVVNEQTIETEKNLCDYLKIHQPFFSVYRIFPESYYSEMLKTLADMDEFLLVTGVNRNEIIEDMIFNRLHSFFLQGNRSVFMY